MPTFELDERGYFWWADEPVPEGHFAPGNAVTGQIQIASSGATKLMLDDFLPRGPERPKLDFGAIPATQPSLAVVGLIRRGREYVRLEQLSRAGLSFGGAQRAFETLKAYFCVRGHKLITNGPPNRYCTSIRLSLAGFEEWLQLENPKLEECETELAARISRRPENTFELDDATLTIGVDVSSRSDTPATGILLQQEGFLIYAPKSAMTLDEVRDTVRKIEDLLVLLTDCERTLGFPSVSVSSGDDWSVVSYETLRRPEKEIGQSDLWTTFPGLLPEFGKIAQAWFAKSPEFGPGFHLYLGNRRGRPLYVEHRFASLVWGLEAFHRSKSGGAHNPALAEKIQRVLNAVEARDRRWLSRVLEHASEPSLAERIFEVLAPLPLGFDEVELKRFINECAKQRNLISHFGGRRDGDNYQKHLDAWIRLSYALDPLYHARILQELGAPEATIRRIVWNTFPGHRIRDALARNDLHIRSPRAT